MAHESTTPATLRERQDRLLSQASALEQRMEQLLRRLAQQCGQAASASAASPSPSAAAVASSPSPSPSPSSSPAPAAAAAPSGGDDRWWDRGTYTPDSTGVVPRLSALCDSLGLSRYRFYRVPSSYYEWPLEQRRDALGAPSTLHLFKSVVMENTHHKAPETSANPRLICVLVSYCEKLHKEKLANALYEHYKRGTDQPLSKRALDASWRLAPESEAVRLTGYDHNAMTPVGMATPLLLVLSRTAVGLTGGSVCLGGGEVDVKWRIDVEEFVRTFKPIVAEIATQ